MRDWCKIGVLLSLFFVISQVSVSYAQDNDNMVHAVQAIKEDKWTSAQAMINAQNDPFGAKLYQWLFLTREDGANYPALMAQFIRKNPEWPGIGGLKAKFEKNMPADMRPKDVSAWFDDYKPKTARGMQRYLDALIGQGRKAEAKNVLSSWWSDEGLSRDEQMMIFERYSYLLDVMAHRRRLNMLLENGQYTNARGIARVLGGDYLKLTEARIALAEQKPDANVKLAVVPGRLKGDYGLLYERIRWRRRQGMNDGVVELLHKAPTMSRVSNSYEWWRERHILARRFIEEKNYRAAYEMAKGHGHDEGLAFAQGEFLAGWLALRFLKQPETALNHFTTLYNGVTTPLSKSRGAYWAGRAAQEFGSIDRARGWYNKAATYQTTFYGQLAGAELGGGYMTEASLSRAAPPSLSVQERIKYDGDELMRAAKILQPAGMMEETGDFLKAFARKNPQASAYHMAAIEAARMGLNNEAIFIAKKATDKGLFLTAQSYPLLHRQMQGINTELALVHGIIRQESRFDVDAHSPAGALGLMQLMPGTAKETARKVGVSYSRGRLTTDPRYNISLGSRYLSDLVVRYNGSYPLAIAAYNAGPGRVNKWIEQFGDPRTGQISLIDWIELIPISETRNYVQRVMEGVYIYRLRLKNIQNRPRAQIHVAMR